MTKKLQRLMYVDDEPDIRAIAQFALEELAGYSVELCATGAEVIKRAPDYNPDLILLDVMMPEMDGIETFKRLSAMPQLAGTPIVFMTAKTMKHEWELYRALGVADIISKPFDPIALPDRIEKIWQEHHKTKVPA